MIQTAMDSSQKTRKASNVSKSIFLAQSNGKYFKEKIISTCPTSDYLRRNEKQKPKKAFNYSVAIEVSCVTFIINTILIYKNKNHSYFIPITTGAVLLGKSSNRFLGL